jgi:HK97 family phage major capsid protein
MTANELLDSLRQHEARHVERIDQVQLRIDELAAKAASPKLPAAGHTESAMARVARELAANAADIKKHGTFTVEIPESVSKSVYSTSNSAPFPVPGVLEGGRAGAPFQLRAMLPAVPVDGGSAWVIKKSAHTSNVAQRSEGATSNEASITIAGGSIPMVSFSTYATLSEEALDDIEKLQQYLERTLSYDLSAKIDAYLLSAIRLNATSYSNTAVTNFSPVNGLEDVVVAAAQLESAGYRPSLAVLNTARRRTLGLIKASGSGDYVFGPPTLGAAEQMADVRLIGSPAQAMTNWSVIDAGRVIVYERGGAMIQLGRIDDDFTKHLYRLRVSERLACSKVADGVAVNGAW